MKNSPIYSILYVFVLCAIAATLLTFPPLMWEGRMAANEKFNRIRAIMDASGLLVATDSQEVVTEKFGKMVTEKKVGDLEMLEARDEAGELVAILFEIEGHGHEGPFKGILAVTPDKQRIKALRVYDHQETPGLGGMMSDPKWASQFNNLPMIVDGQPGIVIDSTVDAPNAVDAITGASTTTHSLEQAINAHPVYGYMRQVRLTDDLLFSEQELDKICGQLIAKSANNRMALQYLLLYPILQGDINKFMNYMSYVSQHTQYQPRSCQEAIAFAYASRRQQPPQGGASQSVMQRYNQFTQAYSSHAPLELYRNTVWYYLLNEK